MSVKCGILWSGLQASNNGAGSPHSWRGLLVPQCPIKAFSSPNPAECLVAEKPVLRVAMLPTPGGGVTSQPALSIGI